MLIFQQVKIRKGASAVTAVLRKAPERTVMSIHLIIDSASDIGMAEATKLGITMLPMQITFGEKEYLDGVELTPTEFYEKLIESDVLPKTSQINEYRFAEA